MITTQFGHILKTKILNSDPEAAQTDDDTRNTCTVASHVLSEPRRLQLRYLTHCSDLGDIAAIVEVVQFCIPSRWKWYRNSQSLIQQFNSRTWFGL